jgi:septum formation protein
MSDFILASNSKSRLKLLEATHFTPKLIMGADIDESVLKKEKPRDYVSRVSREKAQKIASIYQNENVLAADTIVIVTNKIIQKLTTKEEAKRCFNRYSGKNIRVLTGICFIGKNNLITSKVVESKIKFKHFNENDLEDIIKYGDVFNCSGGIKVESFCEVLIKGINGSYSNIVGLPLYEVRNILISNGVKNND